MNNHSFLPVLRSRLSRAQPLRLAPLVAVILFLSLMMPALATAQTATISEAGLKAAVNTLKYVRGLSGSSGALRFGVVYIAGNSASENEAREAQRLIQIARSGSQTVLVPVGNMAGAGKVDVFYIVSGMASFFPQISEYARSNKIFNISLDDQCARQNCCYIAIARRGSSVDVLMNGQGLRSAGFDVDAVLRYMAVVL